MNQTQRKHLIERVEGAAAEAMTNIHRQTPHINPQDAPFPKSLDKALKDAGITEALDRQRLVKVRPSLHAFMEWTGYSRELVEAAYDIANDHVDEYVRIQLAPYNEAIGKVKAAVTRAKDSIILGEDAATGLALLDEVQKEIQAVLDSIKT